jgi:hypothetical protein
MIATVAKTAYTDRPSAGTHYYEVKANDKVNGKAVVTAASNIVKAVVP